MVSGCELDLQANCVYIYILHITIYIYNIVYRVFTGQVSYSDRMFLVAKTIVKTITYIYIILYLLRGFNPSETY